MGLLLPSVVTPCVLYPFPSYWLAFAIPGCMLAMCCGSATGPYALSFILAITAFCHPCFCLFCHPLTSEPLYTSVLCLTVSSVPCCLTFGQSLPVTCFWVNFTKHKPLGKEHSVLLSTLCVLLCPVFFVGRLALLLYLLSINFLLRSPLYLSFLSCTFLPSYSFAVYTWALRN